jgi:hypothetical protein
VGEPVKRPSKYGNVRTVVDGIAFHSAKESRRWGELRLLERAGAITALERQPVYLIKINSTLIARYIGDFRYEDHGQTVVEDVKGITTPMFRLKSKLVKAIYGIEIKVT